MDDSRIGYVVANKILPEITFKGIILSVFLTILLSSSTVYLGLKVGITISASIPAAVIAMGMFSFFSKTNILENNIVQTTVSGGMSLAAGVILCLPSLIILNIWQDFYYWETFLLSACGGVLGVLFAIPFRVPLLQDKQLNFPEGIAIAEILKAKSSSAKNLQTMIYGFFYGMIVSFAQSGLKIVSENGMLLRRAFGTIWGGCLGFSPIMLAAGFIIGYKNAAGIFIGILIGWIVGVPIIAYGTEIPTQSLAGFAYTTWSETSRYIGVGVLLTSGLWVFSCLIARGVFSFVLAKATKQTLRANNLSRLDKNLPQPLIWALFFIISALIFFFLKNMVHVAALNLSTYQTYKLVLITLIYTLSIGCIFSALSGYIAGLVGSSASPLSALALGGILLLSFILFITLGSNAIYQQNPDLVFTMISIALTVGVILICASAIANDIVQDLKVGHLIGATPWKQQIMQIFGVLIAAAIVPFILSLLYHAYGIGGVFPREGMDLASSLLAPQAQLIAYVVESVFTSNMPWRYLNIGIGIAIVAIVVDVLLQKKNFARGSMLSIGIGIYLPINITSALAVGGLVAYMAELHIRKHNNLAPKQMKRHLSKCYQRGFILASGIIAGSTIVGILLAVPFILKESTYAMQLDLGSYSDLTTVFGLATTMYLCNWLYRVTKDPSPKKVA